RRSPGATGPCCSATPTGTSSTCSRSRARPRRHDLARSRREMMNAGLLLTALAAATAIGTLAWYYPKMMGNRAPLQPRQEQSSMALALGLAAAGLLLDPGVLGSMLGAIAALPAALFLLLTFTSGLPRQQPAIAVDALAPDFSAPDAQGKEFHLSALRGTPVLL